MQKRIGLAEMRKIMRELREIAQSAGFVINVHYRPVNWNWCGSGSPAFGTSGQCISKEKKLIVTSRGRSARRDLLFVMAHEVRHALHIKEGLFADYYRDQDFEKFHEYVRGRAERPNAPLPDRDIAWAAEKDCDAWALEFLRSRGIEGRLRHEYPFDSTLASQIHFDVFARDSELQRIARKKQNLQEAA